MFFSRMIRLHLAWSLRTRAASPREIPDVAGLDDDSSVFDACWAFDKNQR